MYINLFSIEINLACGPHFNKLRGILQSCSTETEFLCHAMEIYSVLYQINQILPYLPIMLSALLKDGLTINGCLQKARTIVLTQAHGNRKTSDLGEHVTQFSDENAEPIAAIKII